MKICVLTGGTSAERDVALASAVQVVAALRSRGHRVSVVDTARGYIAEADEATLVPAKVGVAPPTTARLEELQRGVLVGSLAQIPAIKEADVLFLALHGGAGEDGTIQSVLEVIGVPFTGSRALGSALAMDKDLSKKLFEAAGVPVARWVMVPPDRALEAPVTLPVIVKPSKQGSTVGLTLVKSIDGLKPAIDLAFQHDDEVMLEEFIPGRELTVGVLDGKALAVGEIIPKHEIFDYECKYQPGMSEEIFPAKLDDKIAKEAQRLAVLAHHALKLGNYSRIDFRLSPEGKLYCLEANTLPGMTATSLLPQSGAAVGIPFPELCERICAGARR
jgi:D-alanine-D-alanine ligase